MPHRTLLHTVLLDAPKSLQALLWGSQRSLGPLMMLCTKKTDCFFQILTPSGNFTAEKTRSIVKMWRQWLSQLRSSFSRHITWLVCRLEICLCHCRPCEWSAQDTPAEWAGPKCLGGPESTKARQLYVTKDWVLSSFKYGTLSPFSFSLCLNSDPFFFICIIFLALFLLLFYMYENFAFMYVYAPCVCLVTLAVRRDHWIP